MHDNGNEYFLLYSLISGHIRGELRCPTGARDPSLSLQLYLKVYLESSALDPDPDPWIRPFLAGSGSVFGSGSTDPGDIMFSLNSWQNLRAFRLLNFENPSRGSKVRDYLSWGPNFWPKNFNFWPI